MPRLLLFAPFQKAIIDQEDKSISMIALLSGVTVEASDEEDVPRDAVSPFTWTAVAVWLRQPMDEDKLFEQRLRVIPPDGQELGESVIAFAMVARIHHNTVRGNALPVAQAGEHLLELSIREDGTEQWTVVAEYPLEVEHTLPEKS